MNSQFLTTKALIHHRDTIQGSPATINARGQTTDAKSISRPNSTTESSLLLPAAPFRRKGKRGDCVHAFSWSAACTCHHGNPALRWGCQAPSLLFAMFFEHSFPCGGERLPLSSAQ
eukprot:TRINITY_DN64961_c0_g3_i4.p2 TRINITY_DN64961_c0_g3~~TRINITY_DN64961_c0_g3_i4.p2  ORF type:complete len:116 (-),score=5.94 TRINITY_DN64961_c0_g3_i4:133-480(-)